MKSLICKLRRRHDWRVWPSDDDRCETCGLFRLYPSGDIVRIEKNNIKVLYYGKPVASKSLAEPVTRTKPFDVEVLADESPQVRPGPRARPSSLAERTRA
jgi:hypothetical protein